MSKWKGLDSGGTEQLWEDDLLIEVLNVFKNKQPFSRNDQAVEIFEELEYLFPDVTWRNYNADKSFRPIFRKTNPWVKLGLTTPETTNAFVTELGEDLLSEKISLADVFVEATRKHQERDGTHSFQVMCRAALTLPNEIFSLSDVEYGISRTFADDSQKLAQSLQDVRSKKIAFPKNAGRRKRTLRAFMNALVTAGALINADKGWRLDSAHIANKIAGLISGPQVAADAAMIQSQKATAIKNFVPSFKEIPTGKRTISTFEASGIIDSDPEKQLLLTEKAYASHESLVEKCAEIIRSIGETPIEDSNSFDVAVVKKQIIIEVKSINSGNAVSQLRKAMAQLPEYRWRYRETFSESTRTVIVTDEAPSDFVDGDFLSFLIDDRKIKLFWLQSEDLVDSSGQSLEAFLALLK